VHKKKKKKKKQLFESTRKPAQIQERLLARMNLSLSTAIENSVF